MKGTSAAQRLLSRRRVPTGGLSRVVRGYTTREPAGKLCMCSEALRARASSRGHRAALKRSPWPLHGDDIYRGVLALLAYISLIPFDIFKRRLV